MVQTEQAVYVHAWAPVEGVERGLWWRGAGCVWHNGGALEDVMMNVTLCRFGAALGVASAAGVACADVVNAWGLSAYTSANIGTASSGLSGQIARGVMSGGSTYVNNISMGMLTGFGSGSGTSVFAGRDVIVSGSVQGSISAATNVTIKGASVGGSVMSGGELKSAGSGGSVAGNVTLGGTNQAGNSVSIGGSVLQNQAFTSVVNIEEYGAYFQSIARQASASASTGVVSSSSNGNQLSISATGTGTQFVRVGGAMISSARNISVSAAQDATVVVNVTGDAANFSNIGWSFAGGASAARTIFVFEDASSVTVSGSVQASILANAALVQLSSASVSGSVVSMGLIGNGSLGATQFTGIVPAPGSVALAACAGVVVTRRRRS